VLSFGSPFFICGRIGEAGSTAAFFLFPICGRANEKFPPSDGALMRRPRQKHNFIDIARRKKPEKHSLQSHLKIASGQKFRNFLQNAKKHYSILFFCAIIKALKAHYII